MLNQRLTALDSLRGIASLAVLIHHYVESLPIKSNFYRTIKNTPLHGFWDGGAAVMLFFVLSGFVLSVPYRDKPFKLLSFYTKRWFRIYPAYALSIVVAVVLKEFLFRPAGMAPYTNWVKFFWTWDFSQNGIKETIKALSLIIRDFDANLINPVVWSLVLEMQMSMIFPFLIVLVRKMNLTFNLTVLAFLFFLGKSYHLAQFLPVFYTGILLARYKEELTAVAKRFSPYFLFLVGLVLYSSSSFLGNLYDPFKFYIIALGASLFILILITFYGPSQALSHPVLKTLGDWSYSLYLFHVPILLVFLSWFDNWLLIFMLTIITTLIGSAVVFKIVEMPFQRLGKKITGRLKKYDVLEI